MAEEEQYILEIDIVAQGEQAVQEIEKVAAAEDKLHDKTVTINVVTKSSGDATKDLAAFESGARGAAEAARDLERASGLSSSGLANHASAADFASRSMGGLVEQASRAAAMQQEASAATRTFAAETSRASTATRDMASEAARSATAAQRMSDAARPMRQFAVDAAGSALAIGAVASSAEGAETFMSQAAREAVAVGQGFDTAMHSANGLSGGMREVGGEASRASDGIASTGGELVRAGSGFDSFVARTYNAAGGLEQVTAGFRRAGGAAGGGIPPIDIFGKVVGDAGDDAERAAAAGGRAASSFRASALAMPALAVGIAGLAGGAAALAAAGIGGGAVFLGMRQAPQLMHGAQQALAGFNGEFKKTRQAMTDAGMPAMLALQNAAKGLGAELAHVATSNVGTALMAATNLTNEATSAVNRLEPAIGPAITGLGSLGTALLRGVSTPGVVAGIEGVSSALSDPKNMQGIANLTSGFVTFGTTVAQAATDVLGFAGTVAGSNAAGQGGLMGGLAGAFAGYKIAKGPGALAGGLIGLTEGALAAQDQAEGRSPTPGIIGTIAGTIAGGLIAGPGGAFVGGELGAGAMQGAERLPGGPASTGLAEGAVIGGLLGAGVGFLVGGPIGAAGGFALGSAIGGGAGEAYATSQQTPPGTFPSGVASPYGWVADDQGHFSPATSPNDPRGRGGMVPNEASQAPPPPPPPPSTTPPPGIDLKNPGALGFGSGVRSASGLSSIDAAAHSAMQNLQKLGPTGQQSMSQLNAATQNGSQGVRQGMSQMSNAVQQGAPQMQAAASKIPQAMAQGTASQPGAMAGAVHQQVARATASAAPAANAGGGDVGGAMAGGMGKSITKSENDTLTLTKKWTTRVTGGAAPAAEAGGSDAGAAMTGGMGKGITKTETDVLTIVKKWITHVIDAGASALDAHSPSRIFVGLGESIPDGLALGVQNNASGAIQATNDLMAGVVKSGTSTLGGQSNAFSGINLGSQFNPASAGFAGTQPYGAGAPYNSATSPFSSGVANPYYSGVAPGHPFSTANPGDMNRALHDQQNSDAARNQQNSQRSNLGREPRDEHGRPLSPDEAVKQGFWPAGSQADVRAHLLGRTTQYSPEADRRIQDHNARAADLRAAAKLRQQDALSAVRQGITPQEATAQRIQREQGDALKNGQDQRLQQQTQPAAPTPDISGANTIQQQINQMTALDNQKALANGQQYGNAMAQGAAQGMDQGGPQAQASAVALAQQQQAAYKKEHGIASPASVWAGYSSDIIAGINQGLGSGDIQGVASDRGLQVGYTYGRSIVGGADEVIQKDLFQGISVPQIDSPQAKAFLGAMGLLGPAGSGAQIWKSLGVSLGGDGASAATPQVNIGGINVTVDGAGPMRVIAHEVVDATLEQVSNEVAGARG